MNFVCITFAQYCTVMSAKYSRPYAWNVALMKEGSSLI